jgi:hypothetical protein
MVLRTAEGGRGILLSIAARIFSIVALGRGRRKGSALLDWMSFPPTVV